MIALEMITQSGLKSDRRSPKPGPFAVRGQARNLLTSNGGYDTVRCAAAGLYRSKNPTAPDTRPQYDRGQQPGTQ